MQITPDKVKELLEGATPGRFVNDDSEIFSDSRTYKNGICEYGTVVPLMARYGMFAFKGDEELFLASKDIARAYLEKCEENKRLREVLEYIESIAECASSEPEFDKKNIQHTAREALQEIKP